MDAWIEILELKTFFFGIHVASFMDAWIEIYLSF